jgi:hypothetical protein
MDCADNIRCRQLGEKIIARLATGITAEKAVCTYIDSTFSNPDLEKLKSIIEDEANPERDSLIDLLLFPDNAFHLALEPFLLKTRFTRSDPETVVCLLSEVRPPVRVFLPIFNTPLVLDLIPWAAEELVRRLNICWQTDPSLKQVIDSKMAPDRRITVYVKLRNASLTLNPLKTRLLCRFFNATDDTQTHFWSCLDFVVGFISQMNAGDGYEQLMKEKHHYIAATQYALKFEKMRSKSNMETLMLQGVRAPAIGAQEAAVQIDMIDRVAIALYGRTESSGPDCHTIGWN